MDAYILSPARLGSTLRLYPDFDNNSFVHHTAVRSRGQIRVVSPTSPNFEQRYENVEDWAASYGLVLANCRIFADYKPKYYLLHDLQQMSGNNRIILTNAQLVEQYNAQVEIANEQKQQYLQHLIPRSSFIFSFLSEGSMTTVIYYFARENDFYL